MNIYLYTYLDYEIQAYQSTVGQNKLLKYIRKQDRRVAHTLEDISDDSTLTQKQKISRIKKVIKEWEDSQKHKT